MIFKDYLIYCFCRQYFENAKAETVFIGYGSETTALAVRLATEDVAQSKRMEEDTEESLQAEVCL